jgi:hypothetical protein
MSDLAIGRAGGTEGPFRAGTVALMLAVGIAGFVGMLVLGAYAPDLNAGRNGGTHALSNGATGYSGLVRLLEETGHHPLVIRSDHQYGSEDLLILTPDFGTIDLSAPLRGRETKPTLVILPKWQTVKDPDHSGWVRQMGLKSVDDPAATLAPLHRLTIERRQGRGGAALLLGNGLLSAVRFTATQDMQVIVGNASDNPDERQVEALVRDARGGVVVAKLGKGPLYVLADPDLLSNIGMKDLGQARAAIALLEWLNSTGADSIDFDVTMNGLAHSPSPLKLAFEPPFLAMTLGMLVVLVLVGIRALGRFGPTRHRERAIAFGKVALVDNSAALVRKAGREIRLGGRYAAAIRDRAVAAFGVPRTLRDAALDAYLDNLGRRARFTDLVRDLDEAPDKPALVAAARALHDWQKESIT